VTLAVAHLDVGRAHAVVAVVVGGPVGRRGRHPGPVLLLLPGKGRRLCRVVVLLLRGVRRRPGRVVVLLGGGGLGRVVVL